MTANKEEIKELIYELDCGYCETSHDHDKSREKAIDKILSLLAQAEQRGRENMAIDIKGKAKALIDNKDRIWYLREDIEKLANKP